MEDCWPIILYTCRTVGHFFPVCLHETLNWSATANGMSEVIYEYIRGHLPLLNVAWPSGTSRSNGAPFCASSAHVLLQKWPFDLTALWHIKQASCASLCHIQIRRVIWMKKQSITSCAPSHNNRSAIHYYLENRSFDSLVFYIVLGSEVPLDK